jgi:hypothetical protein
VLFVGIIEATGWSWEYVRAMKMPRIRKFLAAQGRLADLRREAMKRSD